MAARDTEGGAAVLTFLQEYGPTTVREVAAAVFPDPEPTSSSSPGYMRAYNWLLSLERVSAAERTRIPSIDGAAAYDRWSAIEGASAPTCRIRSRARIAADQAKAKRGWRVVRLTERMWQELLGVMNDAVIDDPGDVDLRKLRNIVSCARIDSGIEGAPEEAAAE